MEKEKVRVIVLPDETLVEEEPFDKTETKEYPDEKGKDHDDILKKFYDALNIYYDKETNFSVDLTKRSYVNIRVVYKEGIEQILVFAPFIISKGQARYLQSYVSLFAEFNIIALGIFNDGELVEIHEFDRSLNQDWLNAFYQVIKSKVESVVRK